MPLATGQMLQNRYRIVRLIGQGGFGAVYRAWDSTLNLPVAVKENLDTSVEAQRQFEREAKVMAGLRHTNLPRVTDHFLIPGQGQYLVMDYVEGKNLGQMLEEQSRPFLETEILPWIEQVCDALEYLHSLSPPIIHRDIKPQNIIITPDGRAMLVDFGISKVYDPVLSTTAGARAVTPGFSPPEQYSSGSTDARTDVYALGATLYALLTGQRPPESVDILIGNQTIAPPRQINVQLSTGLEQVILKAMDTTTSRRFQRVTDLKLALYHPEQLTQDKTESQKQPAAPVASQPPSSGRSRWGWVAGGLVLLLALAALAGALLSGSDQEEEMPTAVAQNNNPVTAVTSIVETVVITQIITSTPLPATPSTTFSPQPTVTASATKTATAVPTVDEAFRVRISNQYNSINVRVGPGTTYEAFAILLAGAQVTVLAKNGDGTWYNIIMDNGQRGWISASVAEAIANATLTAIPTALTIPALLTATRTQPPPTPTPTQPVQPVAPATATNTPMPTPTAVPTFTPTSTPCPYPYCR